MDKKYCCQIILLWHIIALNRGIMSIQFISIAQQKDLFVGKAVSIASFRAIPKQEKDYSKPIAMRSGIVQQLFSETDASEKSL